MLENTFFCVHIPKTGGTSFRKAFESSVGSSNTYYDYSRSSDATSKLIKEIKYTGLDLYAINTSEISRKKSAFICGHVNIMDYSNLILPKKIFTFIRNPIDRVISHYEHLRRKKTYTGSLDEFCQEERFRNIQHKMLQGYPLHAIGFIGITEDFTKSLEQIQIKYAIALSQLELNKNENKINSEYNIEEKKVSLINSMNKLDLILYERAKKIFKMRTLKSSQHNIYGQVENINNNTLTGWCYRTGENESFLTVEILVNGLIDGTANTVIFRPIFKQINAPREGYVGFRYSFRRIISTTDHISCRIEGTEHFLTDISGDSHLSVKI